MQTSSLNNPLKVYCVPSVKPKQVKDCGLLEQFQIIVPMIILPGNQFGEEGSVSLLPFPVQHVMTQLSCPLNQSELILSSVVVPRERTSRTCCPRLTITDFTVHSTGSQNNPLYASISMPNQPQTSQSDINDSDSSNHSLHGGHRVLCNSTE